MPTILAPQQRRRLCTLLPIVVLVATAACASGESTPSADAATDGIVDSGGTPDGGGAGGPSDATKDTDGGDGGDTPTDGGDDAAGRDASSDVINATDATDKSDAIPDSSLDPRCPLSWTEASKPGLDGLCAGFGTGGGDFTCRYPEGACTCPAYCGGPPPFPGWKPSWRCTPKRSDGCPEAEPAAGDACAMEGKVCGYGPCCFVRATCTAGTWSKGPPICPP